MKKALQVAKWEYLEKVKTKTFLVSLIVTPAIIILFALAPTLLSNQPDTTTKAIGIADTSGLYFSRLDKTLGGYKLENGQPNYIMINLAGKKKNMDSIRQEADSYVLSGKLEGYLLVKNGGTDSVSAEFRSSNAGSLKDISRFQEAMNKTRIYLRLKEAGVNTGIINTVSENLNLKTIKLEKGGQASSSDFVTLFFSSFIFVILLMLTVLTSGGMLIRSLLEEKSNRLIEILISSCSPAELLTGKVFGLSALGLTQVFIWSIIGLSLTSSSAVPVQAFSNIIPILVYFILGFVFFSAIFVGIGSVVTTEQEAQQITSYLNITLILPIALVLPAIENPDSMIIHIFSFIPFTIPAIMMIRFNIGPVPAWEIVGSIFVMMLSIYLSITAAAKIFKVGILSYGKRPSIKELISWIKGE